MRAHGLTSQGICRDFGAAVIRDLVELLETPLEDIFEASCCVWLVMMKKPAAACSH
jgi:hypothetical protein